MRSDRAEQVLQAWKASGDPAAGASVIFSLPGCGVVRDHNKEEKELLYVIQETCPSQAVDGLFPSLFSKPAAQKFWVR